MALQWRWNIDFFTLIFYSTDDVWEYSNIGDAIGKTFSLDRNYIYSWLSLNKF